MKLARALRYLRLRPFDTTTDAGRSAERYRRMGLTLLSTAAARAVQVLTTLVVVRLTLRYLGAERYGLWMTISSLVVLLGQVAAGVGNGLVQGVAAAHGRDDPDETRAVVSNGYVLMGLVGLTVVGLLALAWPVVSWPALFNVEGDLARAESGPAVAALVATFAVNIVVNVISRVQLGLQESYLNNAWQVLGSLLALGAVVVAIDGDAGLPVLVLVLAAVPASANVVNTWTYFRRTRPRLRPRLADVSRPALRALARLGGLFFALQVLYAALLAADNFIVAWVLGAEAVTDYAVPQKLSNILQVFLIMLLNAFWPAYGEALARGDHAWVRRTLRRSLVLALAFGGLFGAVLVLAGKPLVALWVSGAVVPSPVLLGGLAVWGLVYAVGATVVPVLHAAGLMRPQVVWMAAALAVSVAARFALVAWLGVDGIPWGVVLGYGGFYVLPAALLARRHVRSLAA